MRRLYEKIGLAGLAIVLAGVPVSLRGDVPTDGILLWMVYDNYESPRIPDSGPDDLKFIEELRSQTDGSSVNGARIKVAGTDRYLDIYKGEKLVGDGVLSIAKDPQEEFFTEAGPVWTTLGEYGSSAYSFMVELGHWENDEWVVIAASIAAKYDDLVEGGWTTDDIHKYPRVGPWTPEFAAVPEPTSGLLVLVGGAVLALRRRKTHVAAASLV